MHAGSQEVGQDPHRIGRLFSALGMGQIQGEPAGRSHMQPPALFVHPEPGFVIVDDPAGLQGRFDPLQYQGEGTGTLLTSGKHAGL